MNNIQFLKELKDKTAKGVGLEEDKIPEKFSDLVALLIRNGEAYWKKFSEDDWRLMTTPKANQ